jgi:hypothetical protein
MGVVKEKFAEKRKLHRLFLAHSPMRSAGLKTIKNPVSGAGFSFEICWSDKKRPSTGLS